MTVLLQQLETSSFRARFQRHGTLPQIRDSSNPFFTTTNSRIGTSLGRLHEFDAPPVRMVRLERLPCIQSIETMTHNLRNGLGIIESALFRHCSGFEKPRCPDKYK